MDLTRALLSKTQMHSMNSIRTCRVIGQTLKNFGQVSQLGKKVQYCLASDCNAVLKALASGAILFCVVLYRVAITSFKSHPNLTIFKAYPL